MNEHTKANIVECKKKKLRTQWMVYILLEYIAIKGNDKSIFGPNNVVFEVFSQPML